MKTINDFKEAIKYCQDKRNTSNCPLITDGERKTGGCLVRDTCNKINAKCDLYMFYLPYVWELIAEDIFAISCRYKTKKEVLKKYKKLATDCNNSHGAHSEYCGNNCGKMAQHLCYKYLHNDIGGISAVFVNMHKVYPFVKWFLENCEEIKHAK